jgi:Uri superfamily endonuclease
VIEVFQSLQDGKSRTVPGSPGVYILHLYLGSDKSLQVGRFGEFAFQAGNYLYVGSAQGPGGLRARLERHLGGKGRRYWHIDWLRSAAEIRSCLYRVTRQPLECAWSQYLIRQTRTEIPVPGFGASDCRNKAIPCAAHLVRLRPGAEVEQICIDLPVDRETWE